MRHVVLRVQSPRCLMPLSDHLYLWPRRLRLAELARPFPFTAGAEGRPLSSLAHTVHVRAVGPVCPEARSSRGRQVFCPSGEAPSQWRGHLPESPAPSA